MIKLNQSSTWRGLALVGSTIAAVFGYGHLFSAEVSDAGVQLGGVIGMAVPFVVGAYDAIRDELKA
ncbi:hypothetical protein [Photobacterium arenosum]|uniref:hypothetical protein n=1 Tax=Photobacterium arenosum TaxID=2774143 RepID=UPI00288A2864|nr:hypothetical protein [Photobacterium arenosum]